MRNWLRSRTEELEFVDPPSPIGRCDIALVGSALALAVLELGTRSDGADVSAFVAGALVSTTLLWRRRHGLVILALSTSLELALRHVLGTEATYAAHELATTIALYSIARRAPLAHLGSAALITVTSVVVPDLFGDERLSVVALQPLPALVVMATGLVFRYRAVVRHQAEEQVRLSERYTLARELHDTVAHHISAISVQAQAAQFTAATRPDVAMEAMANVERAANQAIDDMRRMIGVLRSDGDQARAVASEDLATLADASGAPPVAVDGDSNLTTLPSSVAAAAFRIVQESITNARRHSRDVSFIDVRARRDDDVLSLEITNDGSPPARRSRSGYGLVGMQERVDALGGTMVVGPREVTGWQVRVELPLRRTDDG